MNSREAEGPGQRQAGLIRSWVLRCRGACGGRVRKREGCPDWCCCPVWPMERSGAESACSRGVVQHTCGAFVVAAVTGYYIRPAAGRGRAGAAAAPARFLWRLASVSMRLIDEICAGEDLTRLQHCKLCLILQKAPFCSMHACIKANIRRRSFVASHVQPACAVGRAQNALWLAVQLRPLHQPVD